MARDTGTARGAAGEALRGLRFHEYAPFAWILVAQLAALALAMNLGTALGMGTMGRLAERIAGDGPIHYPVFFVFLPNLMGFVEAFLYAVPGSVLIPLSVLRVLRPLEPGVAPPGGTGSRLKQAFLPVLVGALAGAALLAGWQWVLGQHAVSGTIRSLARGGIAGTTAVWVLGILVAYAISTCFLYVPVAAVQPGRSFGRALGEGIRASLALFAPTFFVVLLFSLPAALALYVTQVLGVNLVDQIRPEITGVLIAVYSVLISIASYLIYAAASRIYLARRGGVA